MWFWAIRLIIVTDITALLSSNAIYTHNTLYSYVQLRQMLREKSIKPTSCACIECFPSFVKIDIVYKLLYKNTDANNY